MSRVPITLACGDYDRMRALKDGIVPVDGVDLNYLVMPPKDVFWRMLRNQEFDVSEMSMCNYLMLKDRGEAPFTAIPVFPSRFFRHSHLYVNEQAGITRPEDLKGKRVGAPDYHLTALLWIKGMLQHEYNVTPFDMHWVFAGLEYAGAEDRIDFKAPEQLSWEFRGDATLSELLDRGEIDALLTARPPTCFVHNSPNVRRLFPNYMAVEMDYYRRTKLFPIMHALVIRNDVVERYPWLARHLLNACERAKALALEQMWDSGTLVAMLPWLIPMLEQQQEVFGVDCWPYGVEPNRHTLEAMTQYAFEQGLIQRKVTVEELFVPSTLKPYSQELMKHPMYFWGTGHGPFGGAHAGPAGKGKG